MKNDRLKLITIMLLVVLIIMVGFFGIYTRINGRMNNDIKDYKYSSDLDGSRLATIELNTRTKKVIKDSDGKVIDNATEEEIKEKGYITEDVLINSEESKNQENYNLTKEIIKERLKKYGVNDYKIRVDDETGKIVLELPEDEKTNSVISVVTEVGKFEIVDTETKEVLLNNDLISVSNVYRNTTSYGTEISFSIEFNSEGSKKLEEISKIYVPVKDESKEENKNEETQNTEEKQQENSTESEEKKEKTVTLRLDDTDLMSTSFSEPITTGKIYLTVGQPAKTSEDVKNNYNQALKMATLLSTKPMPLSYESHESKFIESPLNDSITNIMIICVAIIILVTFIVLVLKYKLKGLIVSICNTGLAALLLLTIRYWNVELSIEGITAIFVVLLLNSLFVYKMLGNLKKEENNKKEDKKHRINMTIKDFTLKIIPLFIVAIVFVFVGWVPTSSFGMVMFWGLTLIELYNLFITKYVLKYSN